MDGRSHERLTALFLGATAPAFLLGAPEPLSATAGYLVGGLVGTLFLSPDIDLVESRPSRRWGVLSPLWHPYRLLHPHRGASHSYVYGPLSRLAYLGLLVTLFLSLGLALVGIPPVGVLEGLAKRVLAEGELLWPLFTGYLVSQWAHLVQDRVPIRAL